MSSWLKAGVHRAYTTELRLGQACWPSPTTFHSARKFKKIIIKGFLPRAFTDSISNPETFSIVMHHTFFWCCFRIVSPKQLCKCSVKVLVSSLFLLFCMYALNEKKGRKYPAMPFEYMKRFCKIGEKSWAYLLLFCAPFSPCLRITSLWSWTTVSKS